VDFLLAQAGAAAPAAKHGVFYLILHAGLVVKLVMLLLLLFSLISWAIILVKLISLAKAKRESSEFLDLFWSSNELDTLYKKAERFQGAPIPAVFRAGYVELVKVTEPRGGLASGNRQGEPGDLDTVLRAMKREKRSQVTGLERAVPFLATVASASPFIGLFGTVWGIMTSFQGLIGAETATTIQAVAPGIAEALIATAIGLLAAIPAVIFYNLFLNRIKVLSAEMENFSSDFLNIIDRHFL
jgi:biopolymer transport protein TolQ